MKIKTGILLTAVLLMRINGFSQSSFGLRGGVNFSNITGKNALGDELSNKLKIGFNAGVNAQIPVGIDFYLQPGVLYSLKGAKSSQGNNLGISYLEIPVNFLYLPETGKGKLILGAGPYAAFGVGGSYKTSGGQNRDVKFKSDVTSGEYLSGDAYFKRFDAGVNLLFGYEFACRFSVQLNAGLGLVDITPDVEGNVTGKTKQKNTGFGISAGYRFGK